jgi:hypothetical protein
MIEQDFEDIATVKIQPCFEDMIPLKVSTVFCYCGCQHLLDQLRYVTFSSACILRPYSLLCFWSRPVINNEEADGSSYANAFGCSEGLGGWRSTRSRSRFADHPLSDVAVSLSGTIDGVGGLISQQHKNIAEQRDAGSRINRRAQFDFAKESDAAQTASRIDSEVERVAGPHHAANTLIRRQKKHKLTSRNPGECSTSVSDDSDIVFLGSSGENSRPSRLQTRQNWGSLDPVIEVDELSPEMRRTISRGLECINNDDSDARARQVEADEMLARELQEQLYHEEPVVGGGGVGSQSDVSFSFLLLLFIYLFIYLLLFLLLLSVCAW